MSSPLKRIFTGAVLAEQADDLAGVDLEIHALHDLAAAVDLPQVFHFEKAHRRSLLEKVWKSWGIISLERRRMQRECRPC